MFSDEGSLSASMVKLPSALEPVIFIWPLITMSCFYCAIFSTRINQQFVCRESTFFFLFAFEKNLRRNAKKKEKKLFCADSQRAICMINIIIRHVNQEQWSPRLTISYHLSSIERDSWNSLSEIALTFKAVHDWQTSVWICELFLLIFARTRCSKSFP